MKIWVESSWLFLFFFFFFSLDLNYFPLILPLDSFFFSRFFSFEGGGGVKDLNKFLESYGKVFTCKESCTMIVVKEIIGGKLMPFRPCMLY